MLRGLGLSILVTTLVGLSAGSSNAAPTSGHNTFEPMYVCGGDALVFITPSTGANTGWEVDVVGRTGATPFHAKWFSLRVYFGEYETEPTTPPDIAVVKSYGARVGQGEALRCTGNDIETRNGDRISVFLDVDLTRL